MKTLALNFIVSLILVFGASFLTTYATEVVNVSENTYEQGKIYCVTLKVGHFNYDYIYEQN